MKKLSRRDFAGLMGLGAGALMVPGLASCVKTGPSLNIGYTFITWGYKTDNLEVAVKNIAALGYHSFETFGWVIQQYEEQGGIGTLMEKYNIPIRSAFVMQNVLDLSKLDDECTSFEQKCTLLKRYGGKVICFTGGGNTWPRPEDYKHSDNIDNIVKATNKYAQIAAKYDLIFAYHQHTDTPIWYRDEVYDFVDKVDTDLVKLAPDIGQLLKGGTDPVEVVRDFLPMIKHVHLKDYDGGDHWVGYCPLGQGKVDIPAVIELLESDEFEGSVMAELDPNDPSMPPEEAARISRDYLAELGYKFNM